MNCWACSTELIWGGDHEADAAEYSIVSNLHCPECDSMVFVYWGKPDGDE